MTPEHEHNYVFKGTYYTLSAWQRPGSGAHDRFLIDVFFCRACLHEEVKNKRSWGTSYQEANGVLPR